MAKQAVSVLKADWEHWTSDILSMWNPVRKMLSVLIGSESDQVFFPAFLKTLFTKFARLDISSVGFFIYFWNEGGPSFVLLSFVSF